MGVPWTTPEQFKFLTAEKPHYVVMKKKGKGRRFFDNISSKFFVNFPMRLEVFPGKPLMEELTEEESEIVAQRCAIREKQIESWYTWKCGNRTRQGRRPADNVIDLLDLKRRKKLKTKKQPQEVIAYQRLFPAECKAAINDNLEGTANITAGVRLTSLRKVTQALYDTEKGSGSSVEHAVKEYINDWKKKNPKSKAKMNKDNYDSDSDSDTDMDDGEQVEPTPEQYQEIITELHEIMYQTVGVAATKSGWSFLVVAGGPNPSAGGKIFIDHFHFGAETPDGDSFNKAYPGFEANVLVPFSQFLLKCFPQEVRDARAIKSPVEGSQLDAMAVVANHTVSHAVAASNPDADHAPIPDSRSTLIAATVDPAVSNITHPVNSTQFPHVDTFDDLDRSFENLTVGTVPGPCESFQDHSSINSQPNLNIVFSPAEIERLEMLTSGRSSNPNPESYFGGVGNNWNWNLGGNVEGMDFGAVPGFDYNMTLAPNDPFALHIDSSRPFNVSHPQSASSTTSAFLDIFDTQARLSSSNVNNTIITDENRPAAPTDDNGETAGTQLPVDLANKSGDSDAIVSDVVQTTATGVKKGGKGVGVKGTIPNAVAGNSLAATRPRRVIVPPSRADDSPPRRNTIGGGKKATL